MIQPDPTAKALELLARREHSRADLRAKLLARGFAADPVDTTLDKLAAESLQSDERFVEAFVESRVARGQGPLKIAAELRTHSISESEITAALAQQPWMALAQTVRCRRFGDAIPKAFPQQVPQMRFLAQRGFTPEQVRAACSHRSDDE